MSDIVLSGINTRTGKSIDVPICQLERCVVQQALRQVNALHNIASGAGQAQAEDIANASPDITLTADNSGSIIILNNSVILEPGTALVGQILPVENSSIIFDPTTINQTGFNWDVSVSTPNLSLIAQNDFADLSTNTITLINRTGSTINLTAQVFDVQLGTYPPISKTYWNIPNGGVIATFGNNMGNEIPAGTSPPGINFLLTTFRMELFLFGIEDITGQPVFVATIINTYQPITSV